MLFLYPFRNPASPLANPPAIPLASNHAITAANRTGDSVSAAPLSAKTVLTNAALLKDLRSPQLTGRSAPFFKTPALEMAHHFANGATLGIIAALAPLFAASTAEDLPSAGAAAALIAGAGAVSAIVPAPFQGMLKNAAMIMPALSLLCCCGANLQLPALALFALLPIAVLGLHYNQDFKNFMAQWRDPEGAKTYALGFNGLHADPKFWERLTRTLVHSQERLDKTLPPTQYVFSGPLTAAEGNGEIYLKGNSEFATSLYSSTWNGLKSGPELLSDLNSAPIPKNGYEMSFHLLQNGKSVSAKYRAHSREEVLAWVECFKARARLYAMGHFEGNAFHIERAFSADEAEAMAKTLQG